MKVLLWAVWMVPWSYALLPPTNLTVKSQNFNHTLHWVPADGTPPGTEYHIYLQKHSKTPLSVTTATSLPVSAIMRKDIHTTYVLSVEARQRHVTSRRANTSFEPFSMTVLGPPVVRVEGCGDCLLVNSSLPRGDGISPDDFRTFCRSVEHTLHWRRPGGETVITPIFDPSKPKRITHLLPGELYCLRVNLSHSSAPTLASDWQCARTSPALPPGGQYVRSLVGWSMGTVCVGVLVMVWFAALCYTGAICRRKPQLPQSLCWVLYWVVLG
ncbi:cytokine receptor family member b1 isoform X3 [Clupea harengus]|uniref:Cytokine receptor family member b1 isoform X3 n=1 Tax=Clupea harengus TaxID=7950 RepID=A0A6P8GGJ1_CLUHA|nr:cytokine receptor family member b1 isoform X3 [Clupea harengus]